MSSHGILQASSTSEDVLHDEHLEPQILLILVGLPGAGKTTFAEALCHNPGEVSSGAAATGTTHTEHSISGVKRRKWIRASQDDAPNRRRQECEAVAWRGLRDGCNVVVDRVDFDRVQRGHFISLASQHRPRPQVYCLILTASLQTLQSRLVDRSGHPTLGDPDTALRVLGEMSGVFAPPRAGDEEGFDKILEVQEGGWGAGISRLGVLQGEEARELVERIGRDGKGDESRVTGYHDVGMEMGKAGWQETPRGSWRGRGGYAGASDWPPRGGYGARSGHDVRRGEHVGQRGVYGSPGGGYGDYAGDFSTGRGNRARLARDGDPNGVYPPPSGWFVPRGQINHRGSPTSPPGPKHPQSHPPSTGPNEYLHEVTRDRS